LHGVRGTASCTATEPASVAIPGGSSRSPTTTLLLVRHGARHDFADRSAWAARCAKLGLVAEDPPLSALGHAQARETASHLVSRHGRDIDVLLASPYLRVLQTIQPLAHALGKPICVDNSLAEIRHVPSHIPPPASRVSVFPEVDESYSAVLQQCRDLDADGRESNTAYFQRLMHFAEELRGGRYAGKKVACYSHAAAVALVGILTGADTLEAAGRLAPCGIWHLQSDDGGATWNVISKGDENPHVSANDPSTKSWGFKDLGDGYGKFEASWQEARALARVSDRPQH
jgi:broad specificity phosphatase PhoE